MEERQFEFLQVIIVDETFMYEEAIDEPKRIEAESLVEAIEKYTATIAPWWADKVYIRDLWYDTEYTATFKNDTKVYLRGSRIL